jgi:hypothetical protein
MFARDADRSARGGPVRFEHQRGKKWEASRARRRRSGRPLQIQLFLSGGWLIPEGAQDANLLQNIVFFTTILGFRELCFQFAQFFLAVIAPIQLAPTFHHIYFLPTVR